MKQRHTLHLFPPSFLPSFYSLAPPHCRWRLFISLPKMRESTVRRRIKGLLSSSSGQDKASAASCWPGWWVALLFRSLALSSYPLLFLLSPLLFARVLVNCMLNSSPHAPPHTISFLKSALTLVRPCALLRTPASFAASILPSFLCCAVRGSRKDVSSRPRAFCGFAADWCVSI